jgi:hypothetical protein
MHIPSVIVHGTNDTRPRDPQSSSTFSYAGARLIGVEKIADKFASLHSLLAKHSSTSNSTKPHAKDQYGNPEDYAGPYKAGCVADD